MQTHVARLVDTVHVTEAGSDREVRADGRQRVVDSQDVLGLSVESGVVDRLVVDTVLLATSDANFLEICQSRSLPISDPKEYVPSRAIASWERPAAGT